MPTKSTLNALPMGSLFDEIADDAASMAALIPTTASISEQFELPASAQPSEAELEASAHRIRTNFIEFNNFTLSLTRKHRLAVLATATVFKAEALKLDGYLDSAFQKHGVETASNTDGDQAINAAVIRLLTTQANEKEPDKWDISRNATAMSGVEITCADNDVDLTFSMVDRVLELIETSSRSGLMKLVKEREKLAAGQNPPMVPENPAPDLDREPEAQNHNVGNGPIAKQALAMSPAVVTEERSDPPAPKALEANVARLMPEVFVKLPAPRGVPDGRAFIAKVIDGQLHLFGPVASAAEAAEYF